MNCYYCACGFQWQQNNKREIARILAEWLDANPGKTQADVPQEVIRSALDIRETKRKTTADSAPVRACYKCPECGGNKKECGHGKSGGSPKQSKTCPPATTAERCNVCLRTTVATV